MFQTADRLEVNLPKLQDLMKRDPSSYKEEFKLQYQNYLSHLQMFTFNPLLESQRFLALTNFIAHVGHLFDATEVPQHCLDLLRNFSPSLSHDVRIELCKSLILMRNKGHILTAFFMDEFFKLYNLEDRELRKLIFHFLFRAIQRPLKGDEVLKEHVLEKLGESHLALRITVELSRCGTWKDDRTINAISVLCLSQDMKMSIVAVAFFLGQSKKWIQEEHDGRVDDEQKAVIAAKLSHRVGKKTASRKRAMERKIKSIKSKNTQKSTYMSYEPLYSIYDPQKFAEQLYHRLEASRDRFEFRLMIMNLVSRLLGIHQLSIPQFFPFIGKYLRPKTEEITKILLYSAQAVHPLVDHSLVETLIRIIANNFITDANSGEAIAVGLNTVREICVRCPLAMTEDLLRDLVNYRSYKHKSASMSAKSLITLFRTINPKLLHRKDRGRPTGDKEMENQEEVNDFVPGAEILPFEEGGEVESEIDEDKKLDRARLLTRTRFFGDEDHQALSEYRGEESSTEEEVEGPPEIVSYSNLIHLHKSRRKTKEELDEENAERKKDNVKRRKGGKKSTKKSFRATNREKQKMKNFCMLRPKILSRRKAKFKKGKKR